MPNSKARQMRQTSTDAERRMWSALRDRRLLKFKFRRQHPIGRCIVDFACTEHRLVIEIDGSQHADSPTDHHRTAWLESQGWRVIRFWNNDVLNNSNGVIVAILPLLEAR